MWLDVAFDILYVGDTSVIHQSLKERHRLLRKFVKPIPGCLEILVPNGGLNAHRSSGEPCWSLLVHDVDGIERFFKETIENRDEGIVLKDLDSKWEPSDRSGKWLKLKPEYIRAGSDLDTLIIGGYYGSGRRGGEVAQFLVGLAERPSPNTYPKRFLSFCRVGTGLSDEELDAVVTKLKPYFRKYEYPKKLPPSFYQVTNNSKERPDVWIESPEKSIIVSITSDIRTIRSEVFAAPYSLRFPRIDRVRYDKPWHECLDVHSFVELVHSSNGTMQRSTDNAAAPENNPRHRKLSGGKKKNVSVPSHFIQTDVSRVKGETSIFSNKIFYFVNVPTLHSLDSLHKIVVENGGTFSMNLNSSVTHCIASESKGIKFQAAKNRGDVIHYTWLLECSAQKKLLPLQPKHFLFLSETTKKKLEEEVDEFSDSYYLDLNVQELEQLLKNINKIEDSKAKEYCKEKLCPREEWVHFLGCRVYFLLPRQFLKYRNLEIPFELAIRRMKIEICIGGGSIAENISRASHLVIVSSPEYGLDFDTLLNSFSEAERRLLHRRSLHIVKSQWLDDCFKEKRKLSEYKYNLKPQQFQETSSRESDEHDLSGEEHQTVVSRSGDASSSFGGDKEVNATPHKPRVVTLPDRAGKRKRGRPSQVTTGKQKPVVRRTRPIGKKPAKISEYESDKGASSVDKEDTKVSSVDCESSKMVNTRHSAGLSQTRRTRARLRNKPVEINENESDVDAAAAERSSKMVNTRQSAGLSQTRRTRARLINKPVEINENESYEDAAAAAERSSKMVDTLQRAGLGQPRRTRAQLRNKPVEINENESVEDAAAEKQTTDEKFKVVTTNQGHNETSNLPVPNFYETGALKDLISDGKVVEEGVTLSSNDGQRFDDSVVGQGSSTRVEENVDPIQTMLLNMVPSLAGKRMESAEPVETRAVDGADTEEKVGKDTEMPAVKKRKVSYKEMANELLKDW